MEQGVEDGARRKSNIIVGWPPGRRKAATPGPGSGRRRHPHRRDGDSVTGSAANEGLVTSDESNTSLSSDDEMLDHRSTEELVLIKEDHTGGHLHRGQSPPRPGGASVTIASRRFNP